MAYEMKVKGRNILWFPFESVEAFQAAPSLCGVPFLGPWANRINGNTYYVNGRRYRLNPDLGNLRRDGNGLPIHGLLNFSPLWRVVEQSESHVSSRIEFWRHPELMAQFPFAHNLTMTYRLSGGELEVETVVENVGMEPMPVAVGYHPYFRLARRAARRMEGAPGGGGARGTEPPADSDRQGPTQWDSPIRMRSRGRSSTMCLRGWSGTPTVAPDSGWRVSGSG